MTSRIIIAGAVAALTALAFLLSTPVPAAADSHVLISAERARAAGDNRQAIALYRQAHEADPADSAPLAAWGLLAAELGADEQAATLLAAALLADPDNSAAAAGLAETLVFLDRPDEALAVYDTLLEDIPDDPSALAGRAAVSAMIAELQPSDAKTGEMRTVEAQTLKVQTGEPAREVATADADPALLVRTAAPTNTSELLSTPTWR